MSKIHGITVYLLEKTKTGTDKFNKDIYVEAEVPVDNVIVGEPTTDDINSSTSLYGKKLTYILGIPKKDTHEWNDKKVRIRGELFHTIGYPTEYIEENTPLAWNKKVWVERYG